MTEFSRAIQVERGVVNMETGQFPIVLASEGEATDGHILSIPGLDIPARMPMLFGHVSSPEIPSLGSIVEPSKSRSGEGLPLQRAVGDFNLQGDDPLVATRRGIANLVNRLDLPAMSIRWRGDGVPRVELPKGHPHRVERDADGPARFGLFFQTAVGLEGSVVAIGSDAQAGAARMAEESDDLLARAFFRIMSYEPGQVETREFSDAFRAMNAARDAFEAAGVDASSLLRLLGCDPDEELIRVEYGEHNALIPAGAFWEVCGGAKELRDDAFKLLITATNLRALNPQETPTNSPAGEPDADARAEATDGSREVEVTEGVHERKPGTVNDMSAAEFFGGMKRALSDAVEKKTGRRKQRG